MGKFHYINYKIYFVALQHKFPRMFKISGVT
jgi:hypothetical protein